MEAVDYVVTIGTPDSLIITVEMSPSTYQIEDYYDSAVSVMFSRRIYLKKE